MAGSVLSITLEDEGKAKLLQAKYLSRPHRIAGREDRRRTAILTAYAVDGQGSIVAFRAANKVTILAARGDEELKALIRRVKPAGGATAEVEAPMYLDRWDKFAFRHDYRVWQHPAGKTDVTYDFTADFDYAKQEDRAGVLLSVAPLATDSAEGC